jgi:hypothetical protein
MLCEDYDRVEVCYVLLIFSNRRMIVGEDFSFSLVYVTKNAMCCSLLVIEESLYPLIMRIF